MEPYAAAVTQGMQLSATDPKLSISRCLLSITHVQENYENRNYMELVMANFTELVTSRFLYILVNKLIALFVIKMNVKNEI